MTTDHPLTKERLPSLPMQEFASVFAQGAYQQDLAISKRLAEKDKFIFYTPAREKSNSVNLEIILRDFWGAILQVTRVIKEVIGIHVLRTRSPFASDTLRRLLPPVSLVR